jgi:drug/metabolite transporter (DMT)-like permease
MNPLNLPIFYGLLSALTWGAADFVGGLITKKTNAFGVVIVGHIGSLILLVAGALFFGESLPPLRDWLIGMLSGIAVGVGLMFLYRSLAESQMSLASPVSALVGAGMPVLVGILVDGLPGYRILVGFGLALAAIWLIAKTGKIDLAGVLKKLLMPFLAGFCFGFFFIGLHLASGTAVFWPLVATRLGSIPGLILYCTLRGIDWLPERKHWKNIGLISLLDPVGNLFYMLAARLGRLDVAAVISSLYPGSTVALAWVVLKERISTSQMVGILVALVALVLISM